MESCFERITINENEKIIVDSRKSKNLIEILSFASSDGYIPGGITQIIDRGGDAAIKLVAQNPNLPKARIISIEKTREETIYCIEYPNMIEREN